MSSKKHAVKRIQKLLRILSSNSGISEDLGRLVYGVEGMSEVTDPWGQNIINLCDGRSIKKLIAELYSQELGKGSWVADIGMWKTLFDEQIVDTLHKLVQDGYVRIESTQVSAERLENLVRP